MSKSVYSIVLDDDVIKAVDLLASRQGTSRSNMINRILAQHISLPTAETMINDIYNSIDNMLKGHSSLAVQLLGSGSMINMRSALQYKYNPTVRYTVEIFQNSDYIGQLKVSMRSQNQQLINIMESFFYLWCKLEMQNSHIKENEFVINGGKYSRLFRLSRERHTDYGTSIAAYIDLLDKCMKDFFSYYNISPAVATQNTIHTYMNNITKDIIDL